jgi:hypothetical protein
LGIKEGVKMDGTGTFIIILALLALARVFTTKEDIQKMVELEVSEILREERKDGKRNADRRAS